MARPNALDADLAADLAADKKFASRSGGGGGTPIFRIQKDDLVHTIRVLPGHFGPSKKKFSIAQAQHWVVRDGKRLPVYCPNALRGEPCPYCEGVETWRAEEKKAKDSKAPKGELVKIEKIIRACLYRVSYSLNVIDRDEQTPRPRTYDAPQSVYGMIEQLISTHGVGVIDPYNGFDFNITRTSSNNRTSYTTMADIDRTAISDDDAEVEKILSGIHDLEARIVFDEYDRMATDFDAMVESILNEHPEAMGRDLGERSAGRPSGRASAPPARGSATRAPAPARRPARAVDPVEEDNIPMDTEVAAPVRAAAPARAAAPPVRAAAAPARAAAPPVKRPAPAAHPADADVDAESGEEPSDLLSRLRNSNNAEDE